MKTAQFSHKPNNTDISLMTLNFYFPPCKGSPVSNVPGQGQAPMGLAERKLEKPNKFDPFGQKELTLLATI